MNERTFFSTESKARITQTIRDVEAQTSAEVVVSVKRAAGYYRDVDYLCGFVVALAALCALLFLPVPFSLNAMPADVFVGFLAGTIVSASTPFLRRTWLSKRRMQDNATRAARAAFVKLGISPHNGAERDPRICFNVRAPDRRRLRHRNRPIATR